MLIKTEELKEFTTEFIDKVKGTIIDMYFDDMLWNVQYLLIETIGQPKDELVLISRVALGRPDMESRILPLFVSFNSRGGEQKGTAANPASRKIKKESRPLIFRWPLDQIDLDFLEAEEMKNIIIKKLSEEKQLAQSDGDHLRSQNNILGYNIFAKEEEKIGHLDDFIMDKDAWKVRFLVVDTKYWLVRKRNVLISPLWIEKIKWRENAIWIDIYKNVIGSSPVYNSNDPLDEQLEMKLFKHYRHRPE